MHPKGAAKAQWKVVVRSAARRDRGSGNAGHAVLPPRRRQPVPVDQARLVDFVFDTDAKRLADIGGDAECPVRLADAIDRSRLSIDYDIAALQLQDRPWRRIPLRPAAGRVLCLRDGPKASGGGKSSHDDASAGQHGGASSTIVVP